jgi:hypothetical protein
MRTDFERFGFSVGRVEVPGRNWLLTVDFEAFSAEHIRLWAAAMQRWALRSREEDFRFTFFVAIEDAVSLRATNPGAYRSLLDGFASLAAAGCAVHTHNHRLFNPETGERQIPRNSDPSLDTDYGKRPSMYYDVVHRHRADFSDWLQIVRCLYETMLSDIGAPLPERLLFRAGGFDYGFTPAELADYIQALAAAGFGIDSSAYNAGNVLRGSRRASAYGENTYLLAPSVLEIAPCWFVDCGVSFASCRSGWSQLLHHPRLLSPRLHNGVFVTVVHFDHLFHLRRGNQYNYFAVTDVQTVLARIDGFFTSLRFLAKVLRLKSTVGEDLPLAYLPIAARRDVEVAPPPAIARRACI